MITEDYVSFETAKLLKEKGFDESTICRYAGKGGVTEKWYDDYRERVVCFNWEEGYLIEPLMDSKEQYEIIGNTISAPTLQMAMKWLREAHDIHISINMGFDVDNIQYFFFVPIICEYSNKTGQYQTPFGEQEFNTHEEACEVGIKYCLENLI